MTTPTANLRARTKVGTLSHTGVGKVGDIVGMTNPDSARAIAVAAQAEVHSRASVGGLAVVGAAAALESVTDFQRSARGCDSEAEKEADGDEGGLDEHDED